MSDGTPGCASEEPLTVAVRGRRRPRIDVAAPRSVVVAALAGLAAACGEPVVLVAALLMALCWGWGVWRLAEYR